MLQIRNEQLEAVRRNQQDAFVRQMVGHLRGDFADRMEDHGVADVAYGDFVRRGMDKARGYGVTSRSDVRFFIECMAICGPDFDHDPARRWAGEILRRDDLLPESKMELIDQHLLFGSEDPS